jgi:hypothetical protein
LRSPPRSFAMSSFLSSCLSSSVILIGTKVKRLESIVPVVINALDFSVSFVQLQTTVFYIFIEFIPACRACITLCQKLSYLFLAGGPAWDRNQGPSDYEKNKSPLRASRTSLKTPHGAILRPFEPIWIHGGSLPLARYLQVPAATPSRFHKVYGKPEGLTCAFLCRQGGSQLIDTAFCRKRQRRYPTNTWSIE